MTAVSVAAGSTATQVVSAGHCDFIHIYNNSDTIVYISYDGNVATAAAGIPILAQQTFQLNNDGVKPIYTRGVTAIHSGSGAKELRVQHG